MSTVSYSVAQVFWDRAHRCHERSCSHFLVRKASVVSVDRKVVQMPYLCLACRALWSHFDKAVRKACLPLSPSPCARLPDAETKLLTLGRQLLHSAGISGPDTHEIPTCQKLCPPRSSQTCSDALARIAVEQCKSRDRRANRRGY